ncbi:hypothetical protein [Streptomyces sp. NPDC058964]|uniref:hypothetical protein n=1 Tax=Streptomyces sp. NPDC058964 TaxID=3346681 RepID=UPI0036D15E41
MPAVCCCAAGTRRWPAASATTWCRREEVFHEEAELLSVASVAGLVGFSLLLVFVLDRLFAGELSVSPAPCRAGALAEYW